MWELVRDKLFLPILASLLVGIILIFFRLGCIEEKVKPAQAEKKKTSSKDESNSNPIKTETPIELIPVVFRVVNGCLKYGYMNAKGQPLIEANFDDAWSFQKVAPTKGKSNANSKGHELAVVKTRGKFGFINRKGEYVIGPKFALLFGFRDGLAGARLTANGKYGFIGTEGKFAINPKFEWAGGFEKGLALVRTAKKYGFIDQQGKYAIKAQYEDARGFSEDLAQVKYRGKWGYINREDKFVINPQFEATEKFTDGLAAIKSNGKWGYLDRKGKYVARPQFDRGWPFYNGLAAVRLSGRIGFIDKTGVFVIKPSLHGSEHFHNELTPFRTAKRGKIGFIDKEGKTKIAAVFDKIKHYKEYTIAVSQSGLWGYVNGSGTLLIQPKYIFGGRFYHGVALVALSRKKLMYVNKADEIIYEVPWERSTNRSAKACKFQFPE